MEQLFRKAKAGDKVIAYGSGRGVIDVINTSKFSTYPLRVEFFNKTANSYLMDGKLYNKDLAPVCFPIDKAPQHLLDMFPEEKPKRMETVKTSGIVDKHGRSVAWCSSPEDASRLAAPHPDLSVVLLSGEYEVSA